MISRPKSNWWCSTMVTDMIGRAWLIPSPSFVSISVTVSFSDSRRLRTSKTTDIDIDYMNTVYCCIYFSIWPLYHINKQINMNSKDDNLNDPITNIFLEFFNAARYNSTLFQLNTVASCPRKKGEKTIAYFSKTSKFLFAMDVLVFILHHHVCNGFRDKTARKTRVKIKLVLLRMHNRLVL